MELADDGAGVLVYKMTVGSRHAGTRAQKLRLPSGIPVEVEHAKVPKAYPKTQSSGGGGGGGAFSILVLSTRRMHADFISSVPSSSSFFST